MCGVKARRTLTAINGLPFYNLPKTEERDCFDLMIFSYSDHIFHVYSWSRSFHSSLTVRWNKAFLRGVPV